MLFMLYIVYKKTQCYSKRENITNCIIILAEYKFAGLLLGLFLKAILLFNAQYNYIIITARMIFTLKVHFDTMYFIK